MIVNHLITPSSVRKGYYEVQPPNWMVGCKPAVLPYGLAATLALIIHYGTTGASTIDLLNNSILSPAAFVAQLRDSGALITTLRRDAVDWNGNQHHGVAHYVFTGVVKNTVSRLII